MCHNRSLLGERAESDIAPDSVRTSFSQRCFLHVLQRSKGNMSPGKIMYVRQEKIAYGVISKLFVPYFSPISRKRKLRHSLENIMGTE